MQYNTLPYCKTRQDTARRCNVLQCTATHCNRPQRTATHCHALQRTATHCNKKTTVRKVNVTLIYKPRDRLCIVVENVCECACVNFDVFLSTDWIHYQYISVNVYLHLICACYVCMITQISIKIYINKYVYVYVYMNEYIHIYVHIYIYMYIYICIYIYEYM